MRRKGPRTARKVHGRSLGVRLGPHAKMALSGGMMLIFFGGIAGLLMSSGNDVGTRVGARFAGIAIFGAIFFIAGVSVIIVALLRRRKLVVGEDRLQLTKGGRVIGQIPYYNIIDVRMGDTLTADTADVEIFIDDHKDKHTWWADVPPYDEDCDVFIKGGASIDGTLLRMDLKKAVAKYENGEVSSRQRRRR